MRRNPIFLLTLTWLMFGMVSAVAGQQNAGPPGPLLRDIVLSGGAWGHELLLRIEGKYSFKAIQATDTTVLVDLKGVRAGGVSKTAQWPSGALTGYRLLQYTDAGRQPVVRVQVDMKRPAPFRVLQERAGLRLIFPESPANSAATGAAQPAARLRQQAAPPIAIGSAQPAKASGGPARVSAVSIQTGANGEALVDVSTTRPTPYRVQQLANPARLVVDFEEARNGARRIYPAHSALLKGVRVGQFRAESPAVVRVVADLVGNPAFDVHAYPGGVRILLKARTQPSQAAVPSPVAALPDPPAKVEVKPGKTEEQAPETSTKTEVKPFEVAAAIPVAAPPAGPSDSAAPGQKADSISIQVVVAQPEHRTPAQVDYGNALPAASGSSEVTAAPRPEPPAMTPEALQASRAAKMLAARSEVISAAPQGQAPGAAEQRPQYTGEAISVNLKDVDLKDFFRLIHEISGLNIIVDPNVTGSVTLVLDSVPWDQALDIVLKNNRLGTVLEGNVLRIAKIETLTAEQEAGIKLAAAREEAQPLVTVFKPVNYAKAGTIAGMLKAWVGGGALTKRGNILVDDRTNTLIISDIQTQIPIIDSIITKLDKKAKQVSIEARIVLATAAFSRSLAVALNHAAINPSLSVLTASATGLGSSAANTATLNNPNIVVTPASGSGFGVFAIQNQSSRYLINAVIAAAETKSQAKTISRPSIVTQNNVPGSVQQGTQIPIQTTINNTISVQYVSASLQLSVTPQVTEDGNIFMVINVTNASPGAVLTGAGPSINTQSATTQVLVPDGGTVVFGGVTVTTRSRSATQVPLLGSIPIFGHLFKSSNVQDSDQELLFFVSPKVLPG